MHNNFSGKPCLAATEDEHKKEGQTKLKFHPSKIQKAFTLKEPFYLYSQ
jgi:hypothetical protein